MLIRSRILQLINNILFVFALSLLLSACAPYRAQLEGKSAELHDYSDRPIEMEGAAIAPGKKVDVSEAAKEFVEEEMYNENIRLSQANKKIAKAIKGRKQVALSLTELRDVVLENNLDLQVVRFDPLQAQELLRAEEAKFDAVFRVDASYRDADLPLGNTTLFGISSPDPALSGTSGAFTELDQDREQLLASVGIDIPLPTGAKAALKKKFEIDQKSEGAVQSEENRAALEFSLSQPLLRGAGIDVNTASIRMAKLQSGVVSAQTKLAMIRILANAEKAYWKLYAADQVNEIVHEQLDLATKNLKIVRTMIEAGDAAAVERFSAELAVAQQLEALVVAETDVELRSRDLSRILNREDLPIAKPLSIDITTKPKLLKFSFDKETLATRALDERLELLELELKLASDLESINLAENRTLPLLALDFEYGLAERQSSLGDAYGDSFSFENNDFLVGVRFGRPLTNENARAKLRRESLKRQQRLATREQKRLAIRQEVYDAVDIIERNWRSILAARQNVVAAAANYNAEEQMLKAGERAALNVLIALQQLGKARIREVKAIVEYQSAQIDLAYATGSLLAYSHTLSRF